MIGWTREGKAEILCNELGILDKVFLVIVMIDKILSYSDLFLLPSETEI
jgi:hypothetical protein